MSSILWSWERNIKNNFDVVEPFFLFLSFCCWGGFWNINRWDWSIIVPIQAVCCSDHTHCCPNGYTCDVVQQLCTRGNGDVIEWFTKTKAIPEKHVRLLSKHRCWPVQVYSLSDLSDKHVNILKLRGKYPFSDEPLCLLYSWPCVGQSTRRSANTVLNLL